MTRLAITPLMLALAVSTYAYPAIARAQSAPVEAAAAPANLPLRLGELLIPNKMMADKAAEGFDRNFKASLAASPALDKQFSGAQEAAGTAARKLLIDAVNANIGNLQSEIAALIKNEFSDSEQRQLYVFLISPIGRKLVAMGDQALPSDDTRNEPVANDSAPTIKLPDSVDGNALDKLSAVEKSSLAAFSVSPAGEKLSIVTPRLAQLMENWANTLLATNRPLVQQAMAVAIRDYRANLESKK